MLVFLRSDIEEGNIHIHEASIIKARKAEGNPVFAAACSYRLCFKEHVKDQLEVARVQRVLLGAKHGDQLASVSNEKAIQ